MLHLATWVAVGTVLAVFAWLGARAYRDEYLMVLHWQGAGTFFFERHGEAGYVPLAVVSVPAAVVRYGAGRAAATLASARLALSGAAAGIRRRAAAPLGPRA